MVLGARRTDRIEAVAVARTVAFAVEQPHDVELGEITIRPTAHG